MLNTQALKDFEAAIGGRNVSHDPTIIASYSWNTGTGGGAPSERISPIRPVAVVLPGSVEEVQAAVKACLRHGLHFRAQSTGQLAFGLVKQRNTVVFDLRRMNRLIEIDADNQMAVIEPYVTAGDLQGEALKHGLMTHAIGAGWTHSPLASATSLGGVGITGNHTSQNGRNLLAYEWVTPLGEIVRGGSAGSGLGWFAGEGPGPGFRGVIRGSAGAMGALGVFTKIGYKLHPWAGHRQIEHVGEHPNYGIRLSDHERVYQCVWQSWEAAVQAVYELNTSKSATFVLRVPSDHYGWMLCLTNRDYYDRRQGGTLPEIAREENSISWTIMAVSGSPGEADWRDRSIRDIVARTSGRILKLDPQHEMMIARNLLTSSYVPRALRGGSCAITTFGISDSFALIPEIVKRGAEIMKPYKQPGGRMTQGDPEQFYIWSNEGRFVWAENICPVNAGDDKAVADAVGYMMTTFERNDLKPLGTSNMIAGADASDIFGPGSGHFDRWMRKIKQTFDPHWAADGEYIKQKPNPMARFYPLARRVLFRSHRLLSILMLGVLKRAGNG